MIKNGLNYLEAHTLSLREGRCPWRHLRELQDWRSETSILKTGEATERWEITWFAKAIVFDFEHSKVTNRFHKQRKNFTNFTQQILKYQFDEWSQQMVDN